MLTEIKADYVRSGRKRPSSLTVKQIDWLIEEIEVARDLLWRCVSKIKLDVTEPNPRYSEQYKSILRELHRDIEAVLAAAEKEDENASE